MTNKASDNFLVQTEILIKEIGLALADRSSFIEILTFLGWLTGSTKLETTLADYGTDSMAATAEGVAVSTTDIGYTTVAVTVARQAFGRAISRMLGHLSVTGQIIDPVLFAVDIVGVLHNTIMDLAITAAGTFTQDVTPGLGVDLDIATLLDGVDTLDAGDADVGNLACVLHGVQVGDLRRQIMAGTAQGYAFQSSDEAYSQLIAKKTGYQGTIAGVKIFKSSKIPTANAAADRRGFMIAPMALVYAAVKMTADPDARQIVLADGLMMIEFKSDAAEFVKKLYYNAILGVAKGLDAAGVTVTSDA